MRMQSVVFAVLLAASGITAAADRCDWQAAARDQDAAKVQTNLAALQNILRKASGSGVDQASKHAAEQLLQRAEHPQALAAIVGRWKVRSLQVSEDFVYAYPFFAARITDPPACGYRFAKTSGSQRRAGGLYPMADNKRQLAFLGATTVNDDPVRDYDQHSASPHNSAGRLLRIGRNELLMIVDADASGFELYQLKR